MRVTRGLLFGVLLGCVASFGLTGMAAGITQPAGNGGSLLFEDDANAAAGGSGDYDVVDWEAAVAANGYKAADGVTPAIEKKTGQIVEYLVYVNVQNGDGVGSAQTTWREKTNAKINWINGKGYIVSTVGQANRRTFLGEEYVGLDGKRAGRLGPEITFGAAVIMRGVTEICGADINTPSPFTIVPLTSGTCKSIGTRYQSLGTLGTFTIGAANQMAVAVGNKFESFPGQLGPVVANINAVEFDDNEVIGSDSASQSSLLRSTSAITAVGIRFVKSVGTAAGDFESTAGGTIRLVVPKWSRASRPVSVSTGPSVEEYLLWRGFAIDRLSRIPLSGIPIELWDLALNTLLASLATDANGLTSFGAAPMVNAQLVRKYGSAGGAVTDYGPWEARVNEGSSRDTTRESLRRPYTFPSEPFLSGQWKQFYSIFAVFELGAPTALSSPIQTSNIPPFHAGDLGVMLKALGQPCSVAGATTDGIVRNRTVPITKEGEAVLLGTVTTAQISTGSLPLLAIGGLFGTDGKTYHVYRVEQTHDGAVQEVYLAEV